MTRTPRRYPPGDFSSLGVSSHSEKVTIEIQLLYLMNTQIL